MPIRLASVTPIPANWKVIIGTGAGTPARLNPGALTLLKGEKMPPKNDAARVTDTRHDLQAAQSLAAGYLATMDARLLPVATIPMRYGDLVVLHTEIERALRGLNSPLLAGWISVRPQALDVIETMATFVLTINTEVTMRRFLWDIVSRPA